MELNEKIFIKMKTGYNIKSRLVPNSKFFYLMNWTHINEVNLVGYTTYRQKKTYKVFKESCLGVWKIKTKK